eukprot:TRINITY_DN4937_c0_g1_i2.p1 TRINITY_DN4937_c0_g1~~TRINITY_DN4937_c0_g1_i2.p1  ORF type:complete len:278 (-),score=46.73 TRINITY_DN4937_c0_g1_i2:158-991(-)
MKLYTLTAIISLLLLLSGTNVMGLQLEPIAETYLEESTTFTLSEIASKFIEGGEDVTTIEGYVEDLNVNETSSEEISLQSKCQALKKKAESMKYLIKEIGNDLEAAECEDPSEFVPSGPLMEDGVDSWPPTVDNPECFQYNKLTYMRNILHKGLDNLGTYYCDQKNYYNKFWHTKTSPDWKGTGWYRFVGPSGRVMPEKRPGGRHCGSGASGWLNDEHPGRAGDTKTVQICFHSGIQECWRSIDAKITNCGGYFVYLLQDVEECDARYCAAEHAYDK